MPNYRSAATTAACVVGITVVLNASVVATLRWWCTGPYGNAIIHPTTIQTAAEKPIPADDGEVVCHERVTSKPVPVGNLKFNAFSESEELLRAYVRSTMSTFARTPAAWLMKWYTAGSEAKKTFEPDTIMKMDFEPGTLVHGGYTVTKFDAIEEDDTPRLGMEVVLALEPHPSFAGRVHRGTIRASFEILRAETEDKEDMVVFSNEVDMQRTATQAKLSLELPVPTWVHSSQTALLVHRGVNAVLRC